MFDVGTLLELGIPPWRWLVIPRPMKSAVTAESLLGMNGWTPGRPQPANQRHPADKDMQRLVYVVETFE